MTVVIGLSGKKRSGKNTAAKRLVERWGFTEIAFADPIREILYALDPIVDLDHIGSSTLPVSLTDVVEAIGWDRAKEDFPEVRRLLQRLGTEGGRIALGEDAWVRSLAKRIYESDANADGGGRYVITDVRFPNEAEFVTEQWNAWPGDSGVLVRIDRPGIETGDQHASETALDDHPFDRRIDNSGTLAELDSLVDQLAREALAMAECRPSPGLVVSCA